MAYSTNVMNAARRHLKAAQVLYDEEQPGAKQQCLAVAGYLFGLAGELAIKEIIRDSGMFREPGEDHRDSPFYAHFPALKNMLSLAKGRRAGELRQYAEDPRFYQNWDISMRYAPTHEIQEQWVAAWKASAETLVGRMDLR